MATDNIRIMGHNAEVFSFTNETVNSWVTHFKVKVNGKAVGHVYIDDRMGSYCSVAGAIAAYEIITGRHLTDDQILESHIKRGYKMGNEKCLGRVTEARIKLGTQEAFKAHSA